MPALLKIKRSIANDVWRLGFDLDPASLSEDDKLRIKKYGEPKIDVGGTFSYTSTLALVVPTITWATPAPIDYGTPLSGTQLNATANTAGTFTYTQLLGTVLPVCGAKLLTVTFTPTDTEMYTTATKQVLIVVNRVAPEDPSVADETLVVPTLTPIYPTRTFELPSSFLGVRSGLPFEQLFDAKDPIFGVDAQTRALAYQAVFVTRYTDAFTTLRSEADSFTGEHLVNI